MKNKTYTSEEVIELLLVYRLNNGDNYSVFEQKLKWPNSFEGMKQNTKEWLENKAEQTLEESAKEWWGRIHEQYKETLLRNNPKHSIEHIYADTMLHLTQDGGEVLKNHLIQKKKK